MKLTWISGCVLACMLLDSSQSRTAVHETVLTENSVIEDMFELQETDNAAKKERFRRSSDDEDDLFNDDSGSGDGDSSYINVAGMTRNFCQTPRIKGPKFIQCTPSSGEVIFVMYAELDHEFTCEPTDAPCDALDVTEQAGNMCNGRNTCYINTDEADPACDYNYLSIHFDCIPAQNKLQMCSNVHLQTNSSIYLRTKGWPNSYYTGHPSSCSTCVCSARTNQPDVYIEVMAIDFDLYETSDTCEDYIALMASGVSTNQSDYMELCGHMPKYTPLDFGSSYFALHLEVNNHTRPSRGFWLALQVASTTHNAVDDDALEISCQRAVSCAGETSTSSHWSSWGTMPPTAQNPPPYPWTTPYKTDTPYPTPHWTQPATPGTPPPTPATLPPYPWTTPYKTDTPYPTPSWTQPATPGTPPPTPVTLPPYTPTTPYKTDTPYPTPHWTQPATPGTPPPTPETPPPTPETTPPYPWTTLYKTNTPYPTAATPGTPPPIPETPPPTLPLAPETPEPEPTSSENPLSNENTATETTPTPATTVKTTMPSDGGSAMGNVGVIAGAAGGGAVFLVILLVVIVVCCCCRKSTAKKSSTRPPPTIKQDQSMYNDMSKDVESKPFDNPAYTQHIYETIPYDMYQGQNDNVYLELGEGDARYHKGLESADGGNDYVGLRKQSDEGSYTALHT